jgi:hypothetical protein
MVHSRRAAGAHPVQGPAPGDLGRVERHDLVARAVHPDLEDLRIVAAQQGAIGDQKVGQAGRAPASQMRVSPSIPAGAVVSAASAASSLRPFFTALRSAGQKAALRLAPGRSA